MRPRRNEPEAKFEALALASGWKPTKRGWPDFLCFKDGEVIAVEVKPRLKNGRSGLLKKEQVVVMDLLSTAGLRCFVSDGESLELYEPAIHANPSRRRKKR